LSQRPFHPLQLPAGGVDIQSTRLPHEARQGRAYDGLKRRYTLRRWSLKRNPGPGIQRDQIHFGVQIRQQLHDSAGALARVNFVNTVVFGGIAANPPDRPVGTTLDLAPLLPLAAQPDSLVAELNGLLLHRSMTAAMRDTVIAAIEAVPANNALLRVRTAAYLMASSAAYQVEQ